MHHKFFPNFSISFRLAISSLFFYCNPLRSMYFFFSYSNYLSYFPSVFFLSYSIYFFLLASIKLIFWYKSSISYLSSIDCLLSYFNSFVADRFIILQSWSYNCFLSRSLFILLHLLKEILALLYRLLLFFQSENLYVPIKFASKFWYLEY